MMMLAANEPYLRDKKADDDGDDATKHEGPTVTTHSDEQHTTCL